MKRTCALVVALIAAHPLTARGAEITRIASSFEPKDPFGMFLDVTYVRDQRKAKLVREFHQREDVQEVSELRYLSIENALNLDLRLGLYQDLEFHYQLPIVFSRQRTWEFAGGTDESNSTIINNCLQANGELLDANCPTTGAGRQAIFDVPNQSYRGGLGNMTFGLAYAFFNEKKDPSKPMWIVGVDYQAPTADLYDPTVETSQDNRGNIGDKLHRYTFYTSFSKRVGIADPYFRLHYTLPYRGPGWYSNCDHPDPSNMTIPGNCGQSPWTRSETGIKPPHTGGVLFGTEFNAYEQASAHQRVAMDLRLIANYVSEGRYYNELTDVMGKLLYTADYLEVGGAFGLTAQAAEYLGITARGTLTYNTEHNLTDEQIGKDITGNGTVDLANQDELNPNFDYRVDMVSRRFRAAESFNFRIDVMGTFAF